MWFLTIIAACIALALTWIGIEVVFRLLFLGSAGETKAANDADWPRLSPIGLLIVISGWLGPCVWSVIALAFDVGLFAFAVGAVIALQWTALTYYAIGRKALKGPTSLLDSTYSNGAIRQRFIRVPLQALAILAVALVVFVAARFGLEWLMPEAAHPATQSPAPRNA